MKKIIIAFCIFAFAVGCSSSDNNETETTKGYDRTAILTNWADNLIIPAYENYQAKVTTLANAAHSFTISPDETALASLRAAWMDAYIAYQYISIYDFGKAADLYLKQSANTYPTDVAGIEANITAGTYDLNLQAQFSKKGFPAIDYLINGQGTDNETIAYFSGTNAATYLNAIASQLKTIAATVTSDWKTNYRAQYLANNGTSVTSSVNKTTNNFIKNLEKDIRTAKLGIPAGLFSNGTTYPDKVEAYYKNNISKMLLNTAIQAEVDFFNGKSFNSAATGASLKSALDGVNAIREGKNLSDVINTQFTTVVTTNNDLSDSFSQQITNNNSKMVTSYNTLQQNIIYLKVDMMQALNMTIDYVDGDGD